jgi:hypothetical protein
MAAAPAGWPAGSRQCGRALLSSDWEEQLAVSEVWRYSQLRVNRSRNGPHHRETSSAHFPLSALFDEEFLGRARLSSQPRGDKEPAAPAPNVSVIP